MSIGEFHNLAPYSALSGRQGYFAYDVCRAKGDDLWEFRAFVFRKVPADGGEVETPQDGCVRFALEQELERFPHEGLSVRGIPGQSFVIGIG